MTVCVVSEDFPAVDAAGERMIDRAGIMYSCAKCHLYLTYWPPKLFPKRG